MKIFVGIVAIVIVLVFGFIFLNKPESAITPTPNPSLSLLDETVDIKASFTIITGDITRNFSAEKYHNKSPDVYIESADPTIVNVTKSGVTWSDFFETLPMKLTKECLITGDGESLCTGKNGILSFYINDIETPNLLDKEIVQEDKILIKFVFN